MFLPTFMGLLIKYVQDIFVLLFRVWYGGHVWQNKLEFVTFT